MIFLLISAKTFSWNCIKIFYACASIFIEKGGNFQFSSIDTNRSNFESSQIQYVFWLKNPINFKLLPASVWPVRPVTFSISTDHFPVFFTLYPLRSAKLINKSYNENSICREQQRQSQFGLIKRKDRITFWLVLIDSTLCKENFFNKNCCVFSYSNFEGSFLTKAIGQKLNGIQFFKRKLTKKNKFHPCCQPFSFYIDIYIDSSRVLC